LSQGNTGTEAVAELQFTLIVLGQSRRNTIENSVVDKLRACHPGVPIVVVSGSWCEGEKRSGLPLAGVSLVPSQKFEGRLTRFLAQDSSDANAIWQQPLTSTESDRVRNYRIDEQEKTVLENCELTIIGDRYEDCLATSDMLKLYGICPRISESVDDCDPSTEVVCIEGSGVDDALLAKAKAAADEFPAAGIIAIIGFPRPQDRSALTEIGVRSVVAKPFLHSDLVEAIREWQVSRNQSRQSQSVLQMHKTDKSGIPSDGIGS